jgi:uncharacterized NAD(P)/FAD-binding protein YdhS
LLNRLFKLRTACEEDALTSIAIIGAGLSGRLLALNLLRQASPAYQIIMIDCAGPGYMGPAYSNEADYLLLNVPACKMGAISQDPEHFLKWARVKGIQAGAWDFLPRRMYREYVFDLLRAAQQARRNGPSFDHLCEEVTDVDVAQGRVVLNSAGKAAIRVDKAVLALGNFLPRPPNTKNRAALDSGRYLQNPWDSGALASLRRDETVFLIGTGQTAIDLIVALYRGGHAGRIFAISRRGLLPLAHTGFETYPSFYEEIKDSKSLLEVFKIVRLHLEQAEARGIDPRAVIDSLRPDTQALWLGLPENEKRRFLRHLYRYWEIIRSRIPPESQGIIERLRSTGQLEIIAGRINDLSDSGAAMEVRYSPQGESREEIVRATLVINCIGPESDYERIDHPLVKNLLRRGLVRPGPAGLGIDALPNGAVIGFNGTASGNLYTLGSTMRGVLWEVLAVPEIRIQAEQLARLLLGDKAS